MPFWGITIHENVLSFFSGIRGAFSGEIAQTIAAQAPLGVRATLASVRLAFTEGEEAAVKRLIPDLQPLLHSEDIKEGIQSFLERRQAHFQGK